MQQGEGEVKTLLHSDTFNGILQVRSRRCLHGQLELRLRSATFSALHGPLTTEPTPNFYWVARFHPRPQLNLKFTPPSSACEVRDSNSFLTNTSYLITTRHLSLRPSSSTSAVKYLHLAHSSLSLRYNQLEHESWPSPWLNIVLHQEHDLGTRAVDRLGHS